MKLSKFDVEVREEFIQQVVRTNPKVTGDKLQELLKAHFGMRMRIGRLYKVRNAALEALKLEPKCPGCLDERTLETTTGEIPCPACQP